MHMDDTTNGTSPPMATRELGTHGSTAIIEVTADHGARFDMIGRIATQTEIEQLQGRRPPTKTVVYNFRLRSDSVAKLRADPGHHAGEARRAYDRVREHHPDALLIFAARRVGMRATDDLDQLLLNEARAAGAHWFVLTPSPTDSAETIQRRVNLLDAQQVGAPGSLRPRIIPCISLERPDVATQIQKLNLMGHSVAFVDFRGWSTKVLARLGLISAVVRRAQPKLWVGALQMPEVVPKFSIAGSLAANFFGIQACASYIAATGGGKETGLVTANKKPWHVPGTAAFVDRQDLAAPFRPRGASYDIADDAAVAKRDDVYATRRTHDLHVACEEAAALRQAALAGDVESYLANRPSLKAVIEAVTSARYKAE